MVTVGVDLHKRLSQIAVLTPEGEVLNSRLENDPQKIEGFFARFPPPIRVAIEASATWWWLVDLLERLGHQPVLSHPKQTKAIAAARLKNDHVDAERLAMLLRADLLPTVWIPDMALREARELIRHRISLVWLRTRVKNSLQSLLARRNLRPTCKQWMSTQGQQELAALPLTVVPQTIREQCFALLHILDQQIHDLDITLAARWKGDPRVQRLTTIPGVGLFIAMLLVLELGDIRRFPSAKHVASYVGLTPRVRASANHIRVGHISKEGNRLLRWALVVAAVHAARQPGPLRMWFRSVQRRKGTKVARIALARRLAETVYYVWKAETDYLTMLTRNNRAGVSPLGNMVPCGPRT